MTQDVISNIYKETSLCVMYLLFTFGLCNLRYQYKSIHISSCKFFVYFARKNLFFYFIHPLLQNTYINLSILHIYLIKYSFFLHFFYYFLPSPLWHKLTTSSSPSTPTPSQQPFNKIRPLIHRSSTTTKSGH